MPFASHSPGNSVGFVASPTHRAHVFCHQLAPLCKAANKAILLEEERSVLLWDAVLVGDYGVDKSKLKRKGKRSCKRLRRSPCHQVRDAHRMVKDNTEIAFFYLSEMAHATGKKVALTKKSMVGILQEYGPHLRVNHPVSSGGVFLVELCRARQVKEAVILKCVQVLIERYGAKVNVHTYEAQNSHLTALCVAAVRGMPSVVQYLLQKGASGNEKCSGRFRLSTKSHKSIRCTDATALEFAQAMHQMEVDNGATTSELNNLSKSIRLLQEAEEQCLQVGTIYEIMQL